MQIINNQAIKKRYLDMKDKNAIELKENEQSNIHFNYAETTPDHRTAGNLAH